VGAVVSHISKGRRPDFLRVARETRACAAFCKRSRMKFAETHRARRKSGDVGHPSFGYAVKIGRPYLRG
jgi:hypothetical protein